MQSPNRNVIVNEDDNRKLEIYTQGDLDASPSGVGMFASDANGTLRILKQDDKGNLNVNLASGSVSATIGGTLAVYFDQSEPTVKIKNETNGTIAVKFNSEPTVIASGKDGTTTRPLRSNSDGAIKIYDLTDGTVKISSIAGTSSVYVDTITSTVAVKFNSEPTVVNAGKYGTTTKHQIVNTDGAIKVYDVVNGTMTVNSGTGTLSVRFSDQPYVVAEGKYGAVNIPFLANTDGAIKIYDIANGTVTANLSATDNAVLDTIDTALDAINAKMVSGTDIGDVTVNNAAGAAAVNIQDGGNAITVDGSVTANAGSGTFGVYVDSINQTIMARVGQIDGTVAVYFSQSNPKVNLGVDIVNCAHTASVANAGNSVSGSTSGVSVSGVQIVAPEANRVIKVYAFSIMSTAAVNLTSKFTNGSGGSPVELWRVAMISPTGGVAGANLAVTPPGYLFACPSGATLCIVNDNASLIHYSVAYFKESA